MEVDLWEILLSGSSEPVLFDLPEDPEKPGKGGEEAVGRWFEELDEVLVEERVSWVLFLERIGDELVVADA